MKKYKLKITGLDCANCARELEESLQKIKGIQNVSIHFLTERLEFECLEEEKEEFVSLIKKVVKKEEPDAMVEEI